VFLGGNYPYGHGRPSCCSPENLARANSWGFRHGSKIGAHVFFTHYRENERRRGRALDCRIAGRDNWMIARNAKNKKKLTIARAKLAGEKKEKPA
jgi:hypothetical protein